MKKFEEICAMSQEELKKYLKKYLSSKGYKIVDENGFLYATPKETPLRVLLVAHMDTVHHERIKEIQKMPTVVGKKIETRVSSPQGIGGDDRCGIYMIMNLIKEHKVPVLFAEDEEKGCVGSSLFAKTKYCKELSNEIDYMIELDRRGNSDAVFYDCDNSEFTKWIETETNYKKAWGSFTDICKLMPVAKVAGVNFSCGYYNAHTLNEYVVIEEMEHTQKMLSELLKKPAPQQFEFIEKKQAFFGGYGNYGSYGNRNSWYDDWYDSYDYGKNTQKKTQNTTKKRKINDKQVVLTVEVDEDVYGIPELVAKGDTKPECWMNLFMEYDDLCFGYIINYYYE